MPESDSAGELQLESVVRMMRDAGAARLYFKRLAPNDNSRNQVYLGGSFEAINALPFHGLTPTASSRGVIFKSPLRF